MDRAYNIGPHLRIGVDSVALWKALFGAVAGVLYKVLQKKRYNADSPASADSVSRGSVQSCLGRVRRMYEGGSDTLKERN